MNPNLELLVVDDDEMTLFIHEKIISKCRNPFSHKSFRSGEECLKYLENQKQINPDKAYLILLDINMPSMSGWDVLESIRKQALLPRGYVIMATSSVDYDDKVIAEKYDEVIDFFEKPLTLESCEKLSQLPKINSLINH
ncbi:MAG: response regulator [Salibacteraceae bacterium]